MDTNNNTGAQGAQRDNQGEADMSKLNTEARVRETNNKYCKSRNTYIATAQINEYQSITGYQSVMIDLHSADIDSLKIRTKTRQRPNGEKYKIKRIEFTDADGIEHEINIFGI